MFSKHLGKVYEQVSCVGSKKLKVWFNIEALCFEHI